MLLSFELYLKENLSFCFLQYDEAQTELLDLKEKCQKAEQEKQLLSDQLEEYKANMEDLQEKGSKVRTNLFKILTRGELLSQPAGGGYSNVQLHYILH